MYQKPFFLKADALFLLMAGSIQMTLEVAGHFLKVGPYAAMFGNAPYTIGFFEAHGLAFLIALAVLIDTKHLIRFWFGFLIGVHGLLGSANLIFWNSFVAFDMVISGIIATILHGLFILTNTYYLLHK